MARIGTYRDFRIISGEIGFKYTTNTIFVYNVIHLPDCGFFLDKKGIVEWGTIDRDINFYSLEEVEEAISKCYGSPIKLDFNRTHKELI